MIYQLSLILGILVALYLFAALIVFIIELYDILKTGITISKLLSSIVVSFGWLYVLIKEDME